MSFRICRRTLLLSTASLAALGSSLTAWPGIARAAAGKPVIGAWGFDLATIDRPVDPGDDSYRHVNGTWLKTNEIPADRARWGAFENLGEKSDEAERAVIESAAAGPPAPGSSRTITRPVNSAPTGRCATSMPGTRHLL